MSGDVVLGYLGEFKAGVLQGFKLPLGTAGFELDINKMLELAGKAKQNVLRFSQFPSVGRDLTLTVDEKQSYAKVEKALRAVFEKRNYIYKLTPASIYQAEGQKTKNLSFHFEFADPSKTLSKNAIQDIMEELEKVKF
jgi:phenylalanyl-tRNA synthetase beta subunit